MSYIALDPEKYVNADKMVGTGECVALVRQAANLPNTARWIQGAKVAGNVTIEKGTAIATFQQGRYQNRTNGDSHAAIYLEQDNVGIWVIDQYKHPLQPPHKRRIAFRDGVGKPCNDGDAFSVIEEMKIIDE